MYRIVSLLGLLGGVSAEAEADPAHPVHVVPGHPTSAYPVEVPYCANGGQCVPPSFCAPWYLESLYDPAAPCYLGPNTPGVCCVNKKPTCKSLHSFF